MDFIKNHEKKEVELLTIDHGYKFFEYKLDITW